MPGAAEDRNVVGGLGVVVAKVLSATVPVPLEVVGVRDVCAQAGEWEELPESTG